MSDYFNTWYFLGLRPKLFAKWILPRPSKVPGQMSRGQMRLCGHRWSTLSVSIGVQLYDGQPTPLVDTRPVKCDVISLSCRYLVETLSYSCTHIHTPVLQKKLRWSEFSLQMFLISLLLLQVLQKFWSLNTAKNLILTFWLTLFVVSFGKFQTFKNSVLTTVNLINNYNRHDMFCF